jgi:hypothetical protein
MDASLELDIREMTPEEFAMIEVMLRLHNRLIDARRGKGRQRRGEQGSYVKRYGTWRRADKPDSRS